MNQISKCLDQQKIKAICDIVAHTSQGLTKSQLTTLLGQCRICVVDDGSFRSQLGYTIGLNKREWLYNCLVTEINKSHSFCKIISFLQAALNPALYTSIDSRQNIDTWSRKRTKSFSLLGYRLTKVDNWWRFRKRKHLLKLINESTT